MPILPNSRIEIFTTDRYTSVTGHVELAVYATRPLPTGTVVEEVQGSIVPFPKSWSDEMDLVEEYEEAAVEEDDSDDEEVDEEEAETDRADSRDQRDGTGTGLVGTPTKRGKRKKEHKGARRSHRTKRRDFSVIWSNSNKGYLLFLGPARFLNASRCTPRDKADV
jgi:histone-lysine N-methyltransferase SUV420H